MPSKSLLRSVAAVAALTLLGTAPAPVAGASVPRATATTPTLRATKHTTIGARLVRRTQLRTSPGGHVVTTLATRTEYGSQRVLAVVARRGDWLAVLSDSMPNARAGWIPADDAVLRRQHYRIDADRSARLVTVSRDGQVVRRIHVAVGMSSTATPTGRYAVTDAVYFGSGPTATAPCRSRGISATCPRIETASRSMARPPRPRSAARRAAAACGHTTPTSAGSCTRSRRAHRSGSRRELPGGTRPIAVRRALVPRTRARCR